MPLFYYKGKNFYGEKISGMFETESKDNVAKKIKNHGFIPVKIKKIKTSSLSYKINVILNRVPFVDLAVFCEHFAVMLDAGATILDSLSCIKKQIHNKKMCDVIRDLIWYIKQGYTLTEACRNRHYVFPGIFIYMIEAGELSGNLNVALKHLAIYYSDTAKHNEKIKNAMMYPCILGITSLFVVNFLTIKVLPAYVDIFASAGAKLPKSTQILMFVSSNIVKLLAIGLALFLVLLSIILRYSESEKKTYRFDELKLSIPFIGQLIRTAVISKTARVLHILLSNNISLLDALEITHETVKNQVIKKEIKKIKEGLKQGKNLTEQMSDKIFPPTMLKMLAIGEESGNLDEMFGKTASFYEIKTEVLQERMITLIEPTIIIALTFIISFIVIAVLVPMIDVYDLF